MGTLTTTTTNRDPNKNCKNRNDPNSLHHGGNDTANAYTHYASEKYNGGNSNNNTNSNNGNVGDSWRRRLSGNIINPNNNAFSSGGGSNNKRGGNNISNEFYRVLRGRKGRLPPRRWLGRDRDSNNNKSNNSSSNNNDSDDNNEENQARFSTRRNLLSSFFSYFLFDNKRRKTNARNMGIILILLSLLSGFTSYLNTNSSNIVDTWRRASNSPLKDMFSNSIAMLGSSSNNEDEYYYDYDNDLEDDNNDRKNDNNNQQQQQRLGKKGRRKKKNNKQIIDKEYEAIYELANTPNYNDLDNPIIIPLSFRENVVDILSLTSLSSSFHYHHNNNNLNNNNQQQQQHYNNKDVPVLWHVPRAGGSTIHDIASLCFDLVLASGEGPNLDYRLAPFPLLTTSSNDNDDDDDEEDDTTNPNSHAIDFINYLKQPPNIQAKDGLLRIVTDPITGARYYNVDVSTPEGIRAASAMNLIKRGDHNSLWNTNRMGGGSGSNNIIGSVVEGGEEEEELDLVVTPYILEASNVLLSPTRKGRIVVMLRHPIERAKSTYQFLKSRAHRYSNNDSSNNNNNIDENSALLLSQIGTTLIEYARIGTYVEDNWMTRFLSGRMGGSVTAEDYAMAREVLRTRVVIGLLERKDESLRRFRIYLGWDDDYSFGEEEDNYLDNGGGGNGDNGRFTSSRTEDCIERKLDWDWDSRSKSAGDDLDVSGGMGQGFSNAESLLMDRNSFDIGLYDYAVKLFEYQGREMFESSLSSSSSSSSSSSIPMIDGGGEKDTRGGSHDTDSHGPYDIDNGGSNLDDDNRHEMSGGEDGGGENTDNNNYPWWSKFVPRGWFSDRDWTRDNIDNGRYNIINNIERSNMNEGGYDFTSGIREGIDDVEIVEESNDDRFVAVGDGTTTNGFIIDYGLDSNVVGGSNNNDNDQRFIIDGEQFVDNEMVMVREDRKEAAIGQQEKEGE